MNWLLKVLLSRKKYRKLARYCNVEMKFVIYSGLFRIGFGSIWKRLSPVQEVIPYFTNDNRGLIRVKGEHIIEDFIIYFDEEGKIKP